VTVRSSQADHPIFKRCNKTFIGIKEIWDEAVALYFNNNFWFIMWSLSLGQLLHPQKVTQSHD
jgi:hypothetical protein